MCRKRAAQVLEREATSAGFWADEHALALGHTALGVRLSRAVSWPAFNRFVQEGFMLGSTTHMGEPSDERMCEPLFSSSVQKLHAGGEHIDTARLEGVRSSSKYTSAAS